jgi:carbonyl reductase 1
LQLLPNLSTRANVVMVSSGMGELSSLSAELKRAWLAPDLSLGAVEELLANYVELVTKTPRRLEGWPSSAYSVSKIALNALTRVLSREWAKSERRVNAVCPGWVRTDMGGQAASRSVEAGARGIVWAALGAEGVSGGFFRDGKPIDW